MQTYELHSLDEIDDLVQSVVEDFRAIELLPYMQGELGRMADLHQEYFSSGAGPNGSKWGKNAPATVRQKGHGRVLYGHPAKGHRLSKSLTEKANQTTNEAIREAIEVASGGMMTFGSLVEHAGDFMAGRPTSYAPEGRPHIGLNEKYLDAATERLADTAMDQLKAA